MDPNRPLRWEQATVRAHHSWYTGGGIRMAALPGSGATGLGALTSPREMSTTIDITTGSDAFQPQGPRPKAFIDGSARPFTLGAPDTDENPEPGGNGIWRDDVDLTTDPWD